MPWTVPILRALPAIAAAVVITFTGGHSAQYGLVVFAAWAGLTAIVDLVAARLLPSGSARTVSVGRGIAGALGAAIAGLAAAGLLGALGEVERTAVLALTAAATLIVGGMLEAGIGVRSKDTDAYARDWTTAGTIQIIAAIVILFVQPGFEQHYRVEDVAGVITGAIIVIGIIGAMTAILGVLLVLAGISLRSTTRSPGDAEAPTDPEAAVAPEAAVDPETPAPDARADDDGGVDTPAEEQEGTR